MTKITNHSISKDRINIGVYTPRAYLWQSRYKKIQSWHTLTDCRDEGSVERVISVTEQHARFPHTRVSYQKQLKEEVVSTFRSTGSSGSTNTRHLFAFGWCGTAMTRSSYDNQWWVWSVTPLKFAHAHYGKLDDHPKFIRSSAILIVTNNYNNIHASIAVILSKNY